MNEVICLVEKVRTGNRDAFNELYKKYYISLCSYASLLLDKDEVEDVVQDVFLSIWLHRESLNSSRSFQGYLLRSVYNTSLNILKRKNCLKNYHSAYTYEIEQMSYLFYNPDTNETIQQIYNKDLCFKLEEAIQSLPSKCREVFRLSYIAGMSGKEISTKLGISLSTVENHTYAALKQLREKLKKYRFILLFPFFW
jgi:RNA polymerase sigma-70 factor (ECF subfamily)